MRAMRVMVFTPYYPPMAAAAAVRIHEMVKYISTSERIERLDIVHWHYSTLKEGSKSLKLGKVNVFKVRNILPQSVFKHQDPNPIYALYWSLITAYYVIKTKPDVVFFTTPPGSILPSSFICIVTRKKFIVDYRDQWEIVNSEEISSLPYSLRFAASLFHRVTKFFAKMSNEHASLITSVNEEVKSNLEKMYNVRKIIVVKNGISKSELQEVMSGYNRVAILRNLGLSDSEDLKIIAYVGDLSLHYYKPELILNPFKELLEEGYNLYLIVLSGRKSETFLKLIEKEGLEKRVKVLKKSHSELLGILLVSDVGFYAIRQNDPQVKYVMGAKIYEYMSCGLPILAVIDKDTIIHNLIKEYENGIALTWEEKAQLTRSLRELLKEDNKFKMNAKNLVPTFIEIFDRDKQNEVLKKEIEEIESQT